jgi:peptidylprolyl isomerase
MKLRSLAALMAVTLSTGAFAQTTPAPAASPAPQASTAPPASMAGIDKQTLSYAIGYDMARELADRNIGLDVNTIIRAVQDGYAKRPPTMPADKLQSTLQQFQKAMAEQARADFERAGRANKAKSDAFLASNRSKPGITALPSGMQYRVIEPGTGAKPTSASTVDVHLRGSLSTGQEFANTYSSPGAQPATFKISDFPLVGVRDALLMMPAGSRWEVFLPPEKAYGNDPRSPIGPGQAVVFDIKLVNVK